MRPFPLFDSAADTTSCRVKSYNARQEIAAISAGIPCARQATAIGCLNQTRLFVEDHRCKFAQTVAPQQLKKSGGCA
jgi:hypothetical protein